MSDNSPIITVYDHLIHIQYQRYDAVLSINCVIPPPLYLLYSCLHLQIVSQQLPLHGIWYGSNISSHLPNRYQSLPLSCMTCPGLLSGIPSSFLDVSTCHCLCIEKSSTVSDSCRSEVCPIILWLVSSMLSWLYLSKEWLLCHCFFWCLHNP